MTPTPSNGNVNMKNPLRGIFLYQGAMPFSALTKDLWKQKSLDRASLLTTSNATRII